MKRWILFALCALPAFGQVQQSISQLGTTNNWVLAYRWIGSGSGSVPTTPAQLQNCCAGYFITQVETIPGSPAPSAGYSVQITDSAGVDALGGGGGSLSATAPQSFAASSAAPPVQGTFNLVITGQTTANATGAVFVFLTKPGTINVKNLGPGGGGSSPDWLTLANRLVLDTRNFTWSQAPGTTLTAGPSSVTLTPVPFGLNGADAGHSMYITDGVKSEAVLITGGGAISGASSGTVTFTALNGHSGNWTIGSDSSGIAEAVNIAPGVTVEIPTGRINTHAPITIPKSYVRLTGQGGAGQLGGGTVINNIPGTDGIVVNSALTGNVDGIEVDHLQLTSAASTGGFAIKTGGASFARFHDISVEPYPNGIALISATEGARYNTLTFQAIQGDGINISTGTGGAGRFEDTIVGCNRMSGTNGVHALSAQGIMFLNLYVVGCGNGWLSDSATLQTAYVDCDFCYFDTGPGIGINLVPTGTGKVYVWNGTHIATSGFSGPGLHIGAGGTVGGFHLMQYTSNINSQQGAFIEGGSDITLDGCRLNGNSNNNSGAFNGLDITGGNNILVTNCSSGAYDGQLEFQAVGINISGSANNVTIKNNLLNNNLTASLQDTSTGAFRWIADNQGVGVPTVASAATFDPGTLDETTLVVTGTTNITSITRPWDQRNLTFVKDDSGSLTVMGATLAQGGRVDCSYVVGATQWFCK